MALSKEMIQEARTELGNLRKQLDFIETQLDADERTFNKMERNMAIDLDQAIAVGKATANLMDQIMSQHFGIGGTDGQ